MTTGWKQARVGDILKIRNGYAVKSSDYCKEGVPLIRQSDINGDTIDISAAKRVPTRVMEECGQYLVRKGDLLIGMSGSLGKIGRYVDEEVAIQNQRTGLLQVKSGFTAGFAKLVLKLVEQQIIAEGKGVAVQNVSAKEIEDCTFPLPPEGERERIVAEIEKQFTRLDAAVASLKRVQSELKRYRASVLKAACAGRLVPTEAELARKENRNYETGEQLLRRILKERRGKWNGKGKYKEPLSAKIVDLPQLPEGWTWATVDQLNPWNRPCTYGVLQPGPHVPDGVSLVRVGDINDGRVNQTSLKRIAPKIAGQYPRTKLQGGEVAISLVGAIGRTAVIPDSLAGSNTARAVGIMPMTKLVDPHWVEIWFRNPRKIAEMTSKSHEVARKTLNLEDVRVASVALPPFAEQQRIVTEVERRLSVVEEFEATVSANLQRATRLQQSILHMAFTGELAHREHQ